jgi:hypothetical protein
MRKKKERKKEKEGKNTFLAKNVIFVGKCIKNQETKLGYACLFTPFRK